MSRDDSKKAKKPPPSFSGNRFPTNLNPAGVDDIGEETSRRIAFQPSFEPLPSFRPPPSLGETTTTISPKFSPDTAPVPKKSGKKKAPSSGGIWKLKEVPALPKFHPLERTAVFVPNTSPSDVSMRISDVLRDRSIEACYEDEKAKVKCVTAEGVDFRVRLYRGREQFDHGIIVEVQRRFGTSDTFYNDTMAILDAAEGKVPPPPPPMSATAGKLPMVSDSEDSQSGVDATSSIEMVSKMLNHPGYDSHYLALHMLESLTSTSKIGFGTANSVSAELLRMDGDNEAGSKVLSLVIDKEKDDDCFKLRSMAFQVLANAFHAVKGNGISEVLKEQLRPVLIRELRNAEKSPRTAVQAARVVEFFVPQDTGSDLIAALEVALEVGSTRHAALQHQAETCLDKLE